MGADEARTANPKIARPVWPDTRRTPYYATNPVLSGAVISYPNTRAIRVVVVAMSIVMDVVGVIIKPVTDLISEFITDKDKAAELAYKVSILASEQAHEQVMGQIDVNKEEAKSGSLFVSGWRPAAGWCCVLGMAMNFLITPLLGPLIEAMNPDIKMIPLDLSVMLPVLLGMLGLTAARSIDKKNGVA